MNHADIENEYIKSKCKTRTVSELAKKYGVSQSDIIFELLKTGYKFDELKRGNPGAYKPAVKKYERWKKSGGTLESESDEDVLKQYEEKQPEQDEDAQETFSAEQIIDMQKEEIVKLQNQISEMNKQAESKKVHDFNEAVENMVEENKLKQRIRGLEEEVEEAQAEAVKLKVENENLKDEIKILQKEDDRTMQNMNNNTIAAREEIEKLEKELAEQKALSESRGAYLDTLSEHINALFCEAISNHSEYEEMLTGEKLDVITEAVKKMKLRNVESHAEIAKLKDRQMELIEDGDKDSLENTQLKETVKSLEESLAKKDTEINNLQEMLSNKNDGYEKMIAMLEGDLERTRAEIAKTEADTEKLRKCEQYILDMMVYDN